MSESITTCSELNLKSILEEYAKYLVESGGIDSLKQYLIHIADKPDIDVNLNFQNKNFSRANLTGIIKDNQFFRIFLDEIDFKGSIFNDTKFFLSSFVNTNLVGVHANNAIDINPASLYKAKELILLSLDSINQIVYNRAKIFKNFYNSNSKDIDSVTRQKIIDKIEIFGTNYDIALDKKKKIEINLNIIQDLDKALLQLEKICNTNEDVNIVENADNNAILAPNIYTDRKLFNSILEKIGKLPNEAYCKTCIAQMYSLAIAIAKDIHIITNDDSDLKAARFGLLKYAYGCYLKNITTKSKYGELDDLNHGLLNIQSNIDQFRNSLKDMKKFSINEFPRSTNKKLKEIIQELFLIAFDLSGSKFINQFSVILVGDIVSDYATAYSPFGYLILHEGDNIELEEYLIHLSNVFELLLAFFGELTITSNLAKSLLIEIRLNYSDYEKLGLYVAPNLGLESNSKKLSTIFTLDGLFKLMNEDYIVSCPYYITYFTPELLFGSESLFKSYILKLNKKLVFGDYLIILHQNIKNALSELGILQKNYELHPTNFNFLFRLFNKYLKSYFLLKKINHKPNGYISLNEFSSTIDYISEDNSANIKKCLSPLYKRFNNILINHKPNEATFNFSDGDYEKFNNLKHIFTNLALSLDSLQYIRINFIKESDLFDFHHIPNKFRLHTNKANNSFYVYLYSSEFVEDCFVELNKKRDSITRLSLERNNLTDTNLVQAIKHIKNYPNLRMLDISYNKITIAGLRYLLNNLESTTLTSINLKANYVYFDEFECRQIEGKINNSRLRLLDLSMNFIHRGYVRKVENFKNELIGIVCDKYTLNKSQAKTPDTLRYCKNFFFTTPCMKSKFSRSLVSIIPSRSGKSYEIDPEFGIVSLITYKSYIPGQKEHAFIAIEKLGKNFSQRTIIMGDLYYVNKDVQIYITYCSPEAFLSRIGNDNYKNTINCMSARIETAKIKNLINEMLNSRSKEEYFDYKTFGAKSDGSYNCLTWALEMLEKIGIERSVLGWNVPSRHIP